MEDPLFTQSEINDQLQKETDRLAVLQDSLNRSDVMTDNMMGVLTSFEDRLKRLEDTITPVYQETRSLQCRHENIQKTLASLDNVIGHHHVTEEVEPIIRDGPSSGLQNYLDAMEKLHKSVQYFTVNNPGSTQMSSVTTLFDSGKDTLEREFRNLLTRYSKPVPAIAILDFLATDEELTSEDEPVYIEHFSQRVRTELTTLCTWLQKADNTGSYMTTYSTVRSNTLIKSLQGLRDHLKSGSKDSAKMVGMHSPALNSRKSKDTPSKKLGKRMDFARRASSTLKKIESSGLKRPSSASDDGAMDLDIDFYITAVSALLKLMQSEMMLMQTMVQEKHQRRVFEAIITASLDLIMREGEQVGVNIRRATSRNDHHTMLTIFPVLRHLRSIMPEYDRALEGCTTPTRNKMALLIRNLYGTGAKALDEFVDNIKNDSDKSSNTPRDGTVHELTSNTLIFLEQLLEFDDTAGEMLVRQGPQIRDPGLQNAGADRPKIKLAEFVTKALSSLGLNLNNKSESYTEALGAIFMLNNYHYMLKSLKRSGLLDLIHHWWNADVKTYYDEQVLDKKRLYSQRSKLLDLVSASDSSIENVYTTRITDQKNLYLKNSWSKVLHNIMEAPPTTPSKGHSPDGHKLKDKDRQIIKDKFSGFNRELEDIHRIQKGYAIPDTDLREAMKKDNRNFILDKYRIFYTKYSNMPFTKNKSKYVKYTVANVSAILDEFFDTSH